MIRPATASLPILTTLLRERLGFQGPIITDSLIMGAIQSEDTTQQAADLLNAGIDILLDPPNPVAMVKGIVQAVEKGLVPISRLHEASARIDLLRRHFTHKFGPDFFTSPYLAGPKEEVGAGASREKAKQIAIRAIGETGSTDNVSGLLQNGQTLTVFIKPYRTHLDPHQEPLCDYLKTIPTSINFVQIDVNTPDDERARIIQLGKEADTVIIAVVSKPAAWRAFGLPEKLSSMVEALVSMPQSVLVSFRDPALLELYPEAKHRFCTYSDVPASQEAFTGMIA